MAKKAPKELCGRCGKLYGGVQIRLCRKKQKNICYYCCRKCRHRTATPFTSAIGCSFKAKED